MCNFLSKKEIKSHNPYYLSFHGTELNVLCDLPPIRLEVGSKLRQGHTFCGEIKLESGKMVNEKLYGKQTNLY